MRRGNPNLKAAHQSMELTVEHLEEYKKCMMDPVYFMRNYVYITHPKDGRLKFNLYDYQEELVRAYEHNRYNIVLSARQTGKTETSCAYLLWYAIFNGSKTILVVSKDAEAAKEIIKKIQDAYEELPNWLKPGIQDDDWNKHTAAFDNKSRIIARTTTESSGRGLAISLLYCDELAFVKPHIQQAFWNSVFPTLSCVSGNTMVLTDNGFSRIEDMFDDSHKVGELLESNNSSLLYTHKGLQDVSHTYISPASKTLSIKTETGRELTMTPHHPVMSLTKNGGMLTKTEELTIDDYLRVDINTQIFGNTAVNDDEAYMLGGYIAEGWISHTQKGTIWISNTDENFRATYLKNGFKVCSSSHWKLRLSSKSKIQEWEDLGIEPWRKCYNKIIPREVLKFDKSATCQYLAGMFDGDGSVTDKSINYTSTSKQLVQELQIMLNNLGITSRIYLNDSDIIFERNKDRILPQGTKLQSLRDSWSLNIPLSQYQKFKDLIPLKIEHKITKLDEIIKLRKQDDFKHHYVPVTEDIKTLINSVIEDSGKTKEWYRKESGIRFDKCLDKNTNRHITIVQLDKFISTILENKLHITPFNLKILDELNNPDVYWEKISSITDSFCDQTYDFTVPMSSTFTQNGIMGSNTGGGCIITSTPNGDTDLFSTMWRGAEATDKVGKPGVNGFLASRIYWDQPPGRDEVFREEKIAVLGERQWLQEYECEFISSDNSLFDTRIIQIAQKEVEDIQPAFTINNEQEFWKPISPNMAYLVGVDPSTGSGNDFSVIEVFEFPSMIQVMEFRANTVSEVVLYSHLKKVIGFLEKYCDDVYFSVESNGVGRALIALYMQDENPPMYAHFMSEQGKNKMGYTTTNTSKKETAIRFKNMFERKEMLIYSKNLFNEMKSYIRKGEGFEAQTGATDDCISAVFIVMRMLDEIAMYDPRAYEKLYRFTDQASGDEWYTQSGNEDFIPGGVL